MCFMVIILEMNPIDQMSEHLSRQVVWINSQINQSHLRQTLLPKQENYLNNVEEILIMFQIVQIKKTTVDVLQIKSIHLHLELS